MYVRTYVLHVCMYVCTSSVELTLQGYVCTYVRMCVYTCLYIHICTYVHNVCVRVCHRCTTFSTVHVKSTDWSDPSGRDSGEGQYSLYCTCTPANIKVRSH